MSFKLFEIEFDGDKDNLEVGSKKMKKVCEKIVREIEKKQYAKKQYANVTDIHLYIQTDGF